jgi:hypothetical protein
VFDLNFHFVLMLFVSLNFFKCIFARVCLLNPIFLVTLFVGCQIDFDKFYFLSCIMVVVPMKGV